MPDLDFLLNHKAVNPVAAKASLKDGCHPGLYFERIGGTWGRYDKKADRWALEADKGEWLKPFDKHVVGSQTELDAYNKRVCLLAASRGGAAAVAELTPAFASHHARFVTGMGIENPVENGFLFHPTLGTPYIPGSSIKGMVEAFARLWAGPSGIAPALPGGDGSEDRSLLRIFGRWAAGPDDEPVGDTQGDGQNRRGSVVFLDAIPVKPVKLEVDVMTPHVHVGPEATAWPDEAQSPKPLRFLTVGSGNTFQFAVVPADAWQRQPRTDVPDPLDRAMADCRIALEWLAKALQVIGLGAKTKSGYGRFALTAASGAGTN